MCQIATLRWTPPSLAPVFDAVLAPGGVLADVGAFLGMYALWGARRVGPSGRVYAFEPVTASAERVREHAELNGFANIEVVGGAVGAEEGGLELQLAAGQTSAGVTSRYLGAAATATLKVAQTTLDAFFASRRAPDLVKIDVEGMEAEVLHGARGLLASERAPVVVFEAHLSERGTGYGEIVRFLRSFGCGVWSMGPGGLSPEPDGVERPGSMNVLATRLDLPRHRVVVDRLSRVRFPRNQNE
jgi:FkbM family methyltransferase